MHKFFFVFLIPNPEKDVPQHLVRIYKPCQAFVSSWPLPFSTWLLCLFNMLHSPLVNHCLSLHPRCLHPGGHVTLRSSPPRYLMSLFLFTPDLLEPLSGRGEEMHKQNNIIKQEKFLLIPLIIQASCITSI